MNNFSIITCALTGMNLMDSAKITGHLVFDDESQIFEKFTIATYFIRTGGVILISFAPTLIGGILLKDLNANLWILGVSIIMFTSSMIGMLFLQIFVESTSTLFLLYIMDGKLADEGLDVVWVDSFKDQLDSGF